MSSYILLVHAPQGGAYVADDVRERGVILEPVGDHTHAVQHGRVVSTAQQVGDALRLERDVLVRHGPAQVGAYQVHADLPSLVYPRHAATPAQLAKGECVLGGDGVPDATRLGYLLPAQAFQRLLLIRCEGCHMPSPPQYSLGSRTVVSVLLDSVMIHTVSVSPTRYALSSRVQVRSAWSSWARS